MKQKGRYIDILYFNEIRTSKRNNACGVLYWLEKNSGKLELSKEMLRFWIAFE